MVSTKVNYNKVMKKITKSIFVGVFLMSTIGDGYAKKIPQDKVERLVKAMQLDRASKFTAALTYFPHESHENKNYVEFLNCIDLYDEREFTSYYVELLRMKMSHDEIHQALSFFDSPLGKKYVKNGMVLLFREIDFVNTGNAETLSAIENEKLREFFKTNLSQKLGSNQLHKDQSSFLKLNSIIEKMAKVCLQHKK
jgi:hypothetical protein